MTRRHPKRPIALRIIAAGCVVLWLAGVSACSLESLLCCDEALARAEGGHSHQADPVDAGAHHTQVADAHHSQGSEAHHSHDAEGHSRRSHKHGGRDDSCCSTLQAIVQTAKQVVLSKPTLPAIPCLCVLVETRVAPLTLLENPPNRQAKGRVWVFTPEVCLGPAFRSLAPPAFG